MENEDWNKQTESTLVYPGEAGSLKGLMGPNLALVARSRALWALLRSQALYMPLPKTLSPHEI